MAGSGTSRHAGRRNRQWNRRRRPPQFGWEAVVPCDPWFGRIANHGWPSPGLGSPIIVASARPKSPPPQVLPPSMLGAATPHATNRLHLHRLRKGKNRRSFPGIGGRSAVVHPVSGTRQPDPRQGEHHQIQWLSEKTRTNPDTQAAIDPCGFFHVVSNDKNFAVHINHLRKKRIPASRYSALPGAPGLIRTLEKPHIRLTTSRW